MPNPTSAGRRRIERDATWAPAHELLAAKELCRQRYARPECGEARDVLAPELPQREITRSVSKAAMNQVMNCLIVAAVTATACLSQVDSATAVASPEPPHTGQSVFRRLLERSTAESLPPLTREERFRMYIKRTYGPGSTLSAAAVAGFEQWMNTPGEWGYGGGGYRKRFESAYATHIIQGTVEYGVSALMREDNRYRRSVETGVWRRSRHAIVSAFTSTDAAGGQHFSYSRFGGAAAAALSRKAWQPASTDGFGYVVGGFSIMLTSQVGMNLCREFLPDAKRHFLKGK